MSTKAQATFVCGMGNPWTPSVNPNIKIGSTPPPPVVEYKPVPCDHCFCCKADESYTGQGPHLQCCKCYTFMAEKFVKAWFEILGEENE